MLQEPLMEKLTAMRLLGMVDALKAQEQDQASRELSFLERLGLLIDQQWTWRQNQALARRLQVAKLGGACVEEIDYRTARGLDKSVIRALAQKSGWAANHENIFVLGPTGVGKSFIACALAQKACRDGYSALYARAAALFRDLAIARADGSLRNRIHEFVSIVNQFPVDAGDHVTRLQAGLFRRAAGLNALQNNAVRCTKFLQHDRIAALRFGKAYANRAARHFAFVDDLVINADGGI